MTAWASGPGLAWALSLLQRKDNMTQGPALVRARDCGGVRYTVHGISYTA